VLIDNVNDQGTRHALLVQNLEGSFYGFAVLGVGDEDLREGGRERGKEGRRKKRRWVTVTRWWGGGSSTSMEEGRKGGKEEGRKGGRNK